MIDRDQALQIASELTGKPADEAWIGANKQGYVVEYPQSGGDPYAPALIYIDAQTGQARPLGSTEYIKMMDSLVAL
jgi:hypothetical protein